MGKNILVLAYTQVNLGDDLFLKILVDRYPNERFTLLTEMPLPKIGIYKKFHNLYYVTFFVRVCRKISSFISLKLSDVVQFCAFKKVIKRNALQFDAFLNIGGSIFMQQGNVDNLLVKMNCFIYDTFNHSFIIGANFGPYKDWKFLNTYSEGFKKCDSIVFRDSYSRNLFPQLLNISSEPDIVFQYPKQVDKIMGTVGFSVIDLSFREKLKYQQDSYVLFITKSIKYLLAEGKQVYLYSFCKRENDENMVSKITHIINNNNLHIVLYDGDIETFLEKYASMEAMFCTRFHALILSLVFNQKLIPLIYSKKMQQVLDDINFNCLSIDINEINQFSVEETIHKLYECNYTLPSTIRRQSKEMFKDFDLFIKRS